MRSPPHPFRMIRHASLLSALYLAVPLSAQEAWEDDFQRYPRPIEIGTPQGILLADAPGAPGAPILGNETSSLVVAGFVEKGGTRYYVADESYQAWLDSQRPVAWTVIPGGGILPPRPPLLSKGPGIDPDSGEDAEIEVYEETVELAESAAWPLAPAAETDFVLPLKVESAIATEDGGWRATFTAFPNFDSDPARLGFPDPSFNQIGQPGAYVIRQLVSKPARKSVVLTGTAQAERILRVLQPGAVFAGRFADGKLHFLEVGDTMPSVVTSTLSPPHFQQVMGWMAFRFRVSTLGGGSAEMAFSPDKISGADYTNYALIADFGPPFDDLAGIPEWTMSEWSIELHPDQTIHVVAPLMEGRGAPGALELESLGLGPSYEEEIALLENFTGDRPENLGAVPGWISILERKLGPVPEQQRIPETEPW